MGTIQFQSAIGPDGVLNLRIPLGLNEANHSVVVTIQPASGSESPAGNWPEFVTRLFGSCREFGLERSEQGRFESRGTFE